MTPTKQPEGQDTWITYRPQIKVLDCTIRDGGLINEHQFDDAFVKAVYDTLVKAGVDYMELGYKADKKIFSTEENGPWKFSTEDDIRRIVGENDTELKISVMADAERTDYRSDILPKSQSAIDLVRVATYIHQVPTALDMIRDAHDKGYETSFNLMAVTTVQERDLRVALEEVAKSPADVIVVVDSYGSLYSEQVRDLTKMYLSYAQPAGKEVGFHAHNNQQLGFANTIEALICGANRLDATIYGMGRGAGNCQLEMLLGFLRNPKFHMRPILECIQEHFLPLRQKLDWGYSIPYMLTGQLNQHPRAAIRVREGATPDDYVNFYDELFEEDE